MSRPGPQDDAHAIERPSRCGSLPARWLLVVAASAAMILATVPAPAAAGRPDPPTWADEFAGSALDLNRWIHRASGTRHQATLTPEAVTVADDVLTLRTYTESGKHYSGMIASLSEAAGLEQAFGYFEARMKFDSAPGQWSAFWLQSRTIGTPIDDPEEAGVEMDVVEHRVRCVTAPAAAQPCEDRAQSALVWNGYGDQMQSAVQLSDPLPGLSNGTWHTWALNWTPTTLTFLYDDRAIWSRTSPISQRSQYMILSSEVWEQFAGPIPPAGFGSRAESTTAVQVDYVRAWRTPASAPQSTSAPAVTGSATVGGVLACSSGTWSGTPTPTLEIQWLSDGAALAGAAASTYTVQPVDRGHELSCRVTATSVGGVVTAQSNTIAIPAPPVAPLRVLEALAPPPPPPPASPPPGPAPDIRPPGAALSGATSQQLGTTVSVRVACRDEPCRVSVNGTIRVPRVGRARARTYRPTGFALIGGGASATVRLRLSRASRATIRRALRSRRRVNVVLRVRVVDSAGNARTLNRTVTLKLPRRRR
ncbi:MAG TPA: glycoside hydrolase family 16 protein [Solirubrobacteraceae bacterium]|nr:glycoside hydrolase family 16 protein [Solirubrobacteraceae bacterium]